MDDKMITHFAGNLKAQEFVEVNCANKFTQLLSDSNSHKFSCWVRKLDYRMISQLSVTFVSIVLFSQSDSWISQQPEPAHCVLTLNTCNEPTEESFQGAHASPLYRFWPRPFYHAAHHRQNRILVAVVIRNGNIDSGSSHVLWWR